MRAAIGLDPPERRIGLAAHDFAQALGVKEVILARAAKVAGAPAVTSRFVQRLAAVAGEERWKAVRSRGEQYLLWARALDHPAEVKAEPRPAPVPPPEARPDRLSVTDIESWLRDPYTIYAKHVLRLMPLEPVDAEPGAAERGSIIHEAIGDFTKRYSSGEFPADPEQALLAFGERSFAPWQDFPEARAFWWPRFKRIARWFAGWERERRSGLVAVYGEIQGKLEVPLGARTFTLRARADRIERRVDGTYAILDYKTGQPPTTPQVQSGLAPQLTLEAAILRAGGFENVAAGSVVQVSYVRLRGGEPAAEQKDVKFAKDGTPDTVAAGRAEEAYGHRRQIPARRRALPLAGAPDVDQALRRLRSPRARERVGCLRRRERVRGPAVMSQNVPRREPPAAATERQIAAADPDRAVFVSANAGSGKTHVLVQRVINLLLRGEDPAKILCITFTKAAAANMASRVFEMLAEWTTLDDAVLDDKIRKSTGKPPDTGQRARARRLFANALETPGGLKVQTIHAFCTRLLHQFPFEADVAARFEVLDDATTAQMLNDLTLGVILEGAAAPDGPTGRGAGQCDHLGRRPDLQRSDRGDHPQTRPGHCLGDARRRRAAGN